MSDTSESLEQPWYGPKRINAESGIPGALPMTAEQEGPYKVSLNQTLVDLKQYPYICEGPEHWNQHSSEYSASRECKKLNLGYAQGRKSRDEELKTVAPTEASVQASAAKDEAIAEMRNHLDITVNAANLALRAMSVNKPKDAESILRGIVAGISEALAKTEEQRK